MKKFYITTSIPYVNAQPHIGHALEFVQADVVARYRRLKGDDVFFLTGADENSLKNVQAAERLGITTRELVDRNTKKIIDLTQSLSISNDYFIRTVEEKHFQGAQKLWVQFRKGDIYKKKYTGLYCVGCEAFYTKDELVGGKCPEHDQSLEKIEEENYFFKLSGYQGILEKLIETGEYEIIPETRKNEVLSFIRMGLEDFSVSRSYERAKGWGVGVPKDPSQIMYVWFDALSNYITALDFGGDEKRYLKYWPADLHVVGKGIIRFHAVYWPAMLLSAGISLPKKLFVHGYITINGAKMSKTVGNVIDPLELARKYGPDALRYYLLRYVHPVQDSDCSIQKLEDAYTADLANGLGNLVSRIAGLMEQNGITGIRHHKSGMRDIEKNIENFHFDQAMQCIWEKVRAIDVFMSEKEPWVLARQGKTKELEKIARHSADGIMEIAHLLAPFLPDTSQKILEIFSSNNIIKGDPLFPRLDS